MWNRALVRLLVISCNSLRPLARICEVVYAVFTHGQELHPAQISKGNPGMASIHTLPNGSRRILYVDKNGDRQGIILGVMAMRDAKKIKDKIEAILGNINAGNSLDGETAKWLNDIPDKLHRKLVAKGLAKPRVKLGQLLLAQFIDEYLEKRTDLKPRTIINLKQAKRWLVKFFGKDKPLEDITEGDADEFRLFLAEHIGENTLRRICGRSRQYFRAALKKRLVPMNPFAEMKGITVQSNAERQYFVTAEEAKKVLAACPDNQWRLIFALCRYGGLRCPSEHLELTWSDVDWEKNRLTIRSPKTEKHEGKECRVIPLFPELKQYLDTAWVELGDKEAVYIITRARNNSINLRTQFTRIIKKAGLTPWPKLFQNLRSSRETELAETFPIHVVCEWIGNSQAIAKKHYLQVTDAHFDKAISKAAQKAAQLRSEVPRNVSTTKTASPIEGEAVLELATTGDVVYNYPVPPEGLEPSTR